MTTRYDIRPVNCNKSLSGDFIRFMGSEGISLADKYRDLAIKIKEKNPELDAEDVLVEILDEYDIGYDLTEYEWNIIAEEISRVIKLGIIS